MCASYTAGMTLKIRTAWDDLASALIVFAVFAWELLVLLLVDPVLTTRMGDAGAMLSHQLVTTAGWALGAVLMMRSGSRGGLFPDRCRASAPVHSSAVRTLVVVAAAIGAVAVRTVAFGELKVVGEFSGLWDRFGAMAVLAGIVLIAYYVAEAALIVLLILFAQRSGEKQFRRAYIPWGGLVLAATWGVMHIFLQGTNAGFYAMGAAVLYGLIMAYGPRNPWGSAAIVAVVFIL